jgi:O-antigen/teichoic acid export membrane protein
MGRITSNVMANYFSRMWSMVLGLMLTPLYVTWIGLESFGLVGVYNSIQAILAWLDVGISPTLARSLSRLSAEEAADAKQEMRDLVATFGPISLLTGLVAGLALLVGSPLIGRWINTSSLPGRTVNTAIMYMGLSVALQWPTSIFQGGLMALERQVLANAVTVASTGARAVLTVVFLLLISRRIELFLLGQALGAGLGTCLAIVFLLRSLPRTGRRGRFRKDLLLTHWRFAVGMTATGLTTTMSTQVDSIVLTRVLSLRDFGIYSLAKLISNSLSNLTGALVNAFYPRFCQLADVQRKPELAAFYHLSTQAVVSATMALCLTSSFFAYDLVFLWTGSQQMASAVAPPLRLLALGAGAQSLLVIPYYVQLAHGWTTLTIRTSLANLVLAAPVTILASLRYGATGAAGAWIFYNLVFGSLYVPGMHRRILVGEMGHWITEDVMLPTIGALGATAVVWAFWFHGTNRWLNVPFLVGVGLLSLAASAISGRQLREHLLTRLRSAWSSPRS